MNKAASRLTVLIALGLASAACGSQTPSSAPSTAAQPTAAVVYLDAAKTHAVTFDRGQMSIGMVEAAHAQWAKGDGLRGDYIWSEPTEVCTDDEVECIKAERYVFAVPKGTLRNGLTYVAQDHRFTIERCNDDTCTSVIVRADCESFVDGRCVLPPDGQGQAAAPDASTTFAYTRDRGVVSMGFSIMGENASEPSKQFVLPEGQGILAPEVGPD